MKYPYYDPPLKFYTYYDEPDEEPETRATIEDILALEEESDINGNLSLAEIDYELHFGLSIAFDLTINRIEEFNYNPYVISRGGSVAVYRECIRRNLDVDQLLKTGVIPSDKATMLDRVHCKASGQVTIERRLHRSREKCIAYLNERRKAILEWQRQRQQTQQQ